MRIEPKELQKLFNDGQYWERTKTGELTVKVRDHRHPSLMAAHEPFCTYSQMLSYFDKDGNEVARVHQYLRPDGTVGASGKPDPKRLLKDSILYRLRKAPKKQSA